MISAKFKDKNLLFYTPGHNDSDYFVKTLKSNSVLNSQFISIDLRNQNLKIPVQISSIDKPLIMILNGCQEPLVNADAVQWIQSKTSQTNGRLLDSVAAGSRGFSGAKISSINQSGENPTISRFAPITNKPDKIETYTEDLTSGAKKSNLQKKLELSQKERAQFDASNRPVYNVLQKFDN